MTVHSFLDPVYSNPARTGSPQEEPAAVSAGRGCAVFLHHVTHHPELQVCPMSQFLWDRTLADPWLRVS